MLPILNKNKKYLLHYLIIKTTKLLLIYQNVYLAQERLN